MVEIWYSEHSGEEAEFMRKLWKAAVLSVVLCMGLIGCEKDLSEPGKDAADQIEEDAQNQQEQEPEAEVLSDLEAEITWWTYPIFVQDQGGETGGYEQQLIEEFQKYYPNIKVQLEVLDYENGPARVEDAIVAGAVPDVLFDGPERISGYAKKGLLSDLSDLFTEEHLNDFVSAGVLSACQNEGSYTMYPLSMVNYVMAFNKEMLETCGAIDLMNREGARTWDTETFAQVIQRLNNSGFKAGALHCSGVSGDYATRSFLTNLYDVPLMAEDLSAYTFQGDGAVATLTKVKEWIGAGWMLNGSGETGASTVEAFVNGEVSYTLLWSLPQAISNRAVLEQNGIQVVEMPYPSQDGTPSLEYIMNGFCVFESQDADRLQASQYFIDFICNGENAAEHVVRTGALPARKSLTDVYQGNEEALFYEALTPYSGLYTQKVKGFEAMRVYWYQMIAEVLNGEYGPQAAVEGYAEYANETLKEE